MSNEVEQFLNGGGAPSAKFPTIGTTVKGKIVEPAPSLSQQTEPNGTPKTWPDGNPMMQLVVHVQTDTRDSEDDDGIRRVFVGSKGMKDAVREAVKAAGATSIEVGGELAVQYSGDGEKTNPAFSAPKLFKAAYKAPAPSSVSADDLL